MGSTGILAPRTREAGLKSKRTKSQREILIEGLTEGASEKKHSEKHAHGGVLDGDLTGMEDEEGYVEIEDIADVAAKWYRHQLRKRRDTFKARKHLDSGRFLQSSVFNLLAPVLLVGVWAGAIVAYILVLARSTERSSLQMSLTEELQSEVEALGIDVLDIMTT